MIILDSNVIIEFIQGVAKVCRFIAKHREKGELFGLSTLSVIEVLGFPKSQSVELLKIEHWLRFRIVIDVDLSIARCAAKLRRVYNLQTTDSAIAATAVINKAVLASSDKVFRKIKELDLVIP